MYNELKQCFIEFFIIAVHLYVNNKNEIMLVPTLPNERESIFNYSGICKMPNRTAIINLI